MSSEQFSNSINDLENNIGKIILENQVEVLNSSLSSVISLFGAIGSIAALFIVALVFWLNSTVNKKLKSIEVKKSEIDSIAEDIRKNKKDISQYYERTKKLENNISHILKLEEDVKGFDLMKNILIVYIKCYQENSLELKRGYEYIKQYKSILSDIEKNRKDLEKTYKDKNINFDERLEYICNYYDDEESKFQEWNLYDWDLDKFIIKHIENIDARKFKEINEDNEWYYIGELSWMVPELKLISEGKYEG
ncbi:hypothetical protein FOH38_23680 [Lysinibacillus fusiformis]|nr:hypothetical protein FOH38_23680 [Lysinibacillus fusiformis]